MDDVKILQKDSKSNKKIHDQSRKKYIRDELGCAIVSYSKRCGYLGIVLDVMKKHRVDTGTTHC